MVRLGHWTEGLSGESVCARVELLQGPHELFKNSRNEALVGVYGYLTHMQSVIRRLQVAGNKVAAGCRCLLLPLRG